MTDNIKLTIKESEIEELVVEIINIADEISIIFDGIDTSVDTIKEYLLCGANKNIANKYQEIRKNYQIIKNNIISYSADLVSLNTKMHDGEKYLINKFNAKTAEINAKKKEVDINGS